MMKRRDNPAGEPCRDWKDTLADVLMLFVILLMGAVIGIGLRKFCPGFWNWLNGDWAKSPWIPRALLAVGGTCISVGLCIKEVRYDRKENT